MQLKSFALHLGPRLVLGALLAACYPITRGGIQNLTALFVWAVMAGGLAYALRPAEYAGCPSSRHSMYGRSRWAILIILAATISFGIVGWNTHRAHPRTADELCSLGQARAFASLSATLPLTAFDKHVDPTNACFARSERGYFSVQGPGWPALLATLKASGIPQERVPWLIATFTLFLTGLAGLILAGLPVALMSMAMLANNQFFDEMSRSLWSHASCMLCVALALVAMLQALSPHLKNRSPTLLLLGLSLGLAMLIRPLVGLSCLMGVVCALTIMRNNRALITSRGLVSLAAGPAISCILYGMFNFSTTGNFFVSGYEFVHGPGHNPGFFHVAPNGNIHSPERALMLLHHHVRHLVQFVLPYRWTFWAVVGVLVTIGWSRGVAALLVVLGAMWLGAATYWDSSYFVGPRFYYESTTLLTLLITMSVCSLTERASFFIHSPRLASIAHVGIFVLVSVLLLPSPPVQ